MLSCPTCLVPHVFLCLTCSCALRTLVPCVPLVLRGLVSHVPRVLCALVFYEVLFFTYPQCLVPFVLHVLIPLFVLLSSYVSRPYFSVRFLILIYFLENLLKLEQIYRVSQKKEPPKLITYKKVGTHGHWLPCRLSILW